MQVIVVASLGFYNAWKAKRRVSDGSIDNKRSAVASGACSSACISARNADSLLTLQVLWSSPHQLRAG